MANESARPAQRQVASAAAQPRLGLLFLGLAAILTFFGAVGLVLYLKPGGETPAPAAIFVAGPLEGFEPGTATYFKSEHVHVVRLMDGGLVAIYDLGPRMQALFQETGDRHWLDCRAEYATDEFDLTVGQPMPAGFADKVLREPCHGSTWDITGVRLYGPTSGSLDRFPVAVVEGIVQVNVANRRCMNPVSEQAPCLETQ
jgi:hypothetical protein